MFHPTRGGTRGGRDQFKWEDVKDDKYREYYLGHSLMAPVGRWQQGKDLTWYAKDKKDDTQTKAQKSEIAKIKEAEAEAMAIALGVRKKKKLESNVTEDDLKHALNKNDDESDDDERRVDTTEKGLGYGKRVPMTQQAMAGDVEVMSRSSGDNSYHQHPSYAADRVEQPSFRANSEENMESSKKEKDRKSKKHHKDKSAKRKSKKHRSHRHHKDSDDSDVDGKTDSNSRRRSYHRHHERDRSHSRETSDGHRRERNPDRYDDYDSRHHHFSHSTREDRYSSKHDRYHSKRNRYNRSPSPHQTDRERQRRRHSYSRSRSPLRSPSPIKERSLSPYSRRAALSKK